MKKISQVTALWWLCFVFIITNIASILCFAAEHDERVKYEQSACVLADVCHSALDCKDLDATAFEELYEDALCNTDCYGLCVDREFIDSLYWAY